MDDRQYLDYVYATLVSWGMHRMGKGGAKMRSMDDFRQGVRAQRSRIADIQHLELQRLSGDATDEVASKLWAIMDGFQIAVGSTRLVAGSKVLHHLLPALVPPIDRQYTLRYFYDNQAIYRNKQEQMVRTLLPLFREIAIACVGPIAVALAHPSCPMDASVTNVIDNAIVGFCIRELSEPPSPEQAG